MKRILVIKLGALGDFILSTGAFSDIRAHHKNDHITLLTQPPYAGLGEKTGCFDAVSVDPRKPFWNIKYLIEMRRKLGGFDMVYDLQTNDRSAAYFHLAGKPQWSGIAKGCSHPQRNQNRNNMHTIDRVQDQLRDAGLTPSHEVDFRFAASDIAGLLKRYDLEDEHFTVLVPGGAPHRPGKRWPHFEDLAHYLLNHGHKVVLIGTNAEEDILKRISEKTGAINLCGKTNIAQLADLFVRSQYCVGNDTGPMHIAAACGATGAVLFGNESNPELCAPRSETMAIMQKENIASISPQEVLEKLGISKA